MLNEGSSAVPVPVCITSARETACHNNSPQWTCQLSCAARLQCFNCISAEGIWFHSLKASTHVSTMWDWGLHEERLLVPQGIPTRKFPLPPDCSTEHFSKYSLSHNEPSDHILLQPVFGKDTPSATCRLTGWQLPLLSSLLPMSSSPREAVAGDQACGWQNVSVLIYMEMQAPACSTCQSDCLSVSTWTDSEYTAFVYMRKKWMCGKFKHL